MKAMKGKFRNKKGFTLVEMLIVVAIIAILIAVSIPLVSNSLEKARDATDQANERAAKAEAAMVYLGVTDLTWSGSIEDTWFFYNAETGELEAGSYSGKSYGKCTKEHDNDEHLFASVTDYRDEYAEEDKGDHVDKYLMVLIYEDGAVKTIWWK